MRDRARFWAPERAAEDWPVGQATWLRARRAAPRVALVLLAASGLLRPAILEGGQELREEGDVDGYVGVAFWPARSKDDLTRADPRGFSVVLMPTDGKSELRYPAGEWFLPPDDRYRALLASRDQISPFPNILAFARTPFGGRGMALVHPVFPAGSIRVDPPRSDSRKLALRALHSESHTWLGGLGPEMSREALLSSESGATLTMPKGDVAVALLDLDADEYVAVGRLVVKQGESTTWAPERPPKGRSAVVVVAHRAGKEYLSDAADDDVTIHWVDAGGHPIPVDLRIGTNRKIFGFWFDVPSGNGRLQVASARSWLEPRDFTLRSGHVERFEFELKKNPRLSVRLEVPDGLGFDPLAVEVEVLGALSGRRIVGPLEAGSLEAHFPAAPPEPVTVTAKLAPWELRGQVDLSDGEDAEVTLRAEDIAIFGTVFYGSRPVAARVRISTSRDGDDLWIETDDEGSYRALLVEAKTYLFSVLLPDRGAPWVVPAEIEESGRFDLHVPANSVEFLVSDKETGAAIDGAVVLLENEGEDGLKTSQRITTDREGRAGAHPLRPGTMEFIAQASGYLPSSARAEPIPEPDEEYELELEVALDPLGDEVPVHLELWDGRPAAGAEVLVPGPGVPPGWVSRADVHGVVHVPETLAGRSLVIKHPAASPGLHSVPGAEGVVRLSGLDGERVTLRVVDASGDPLPWAVVVLYIDGTRLDFETARWLTGTHPAADSEGFWTWDAAPRNRAGVLAVAPGSGSVQLAQLGAFDGDRRSLPTPAPTVLELRAVP